MNIRNQPANLPNKPPGVGDWPLYARMAVLGVLLLSTVVLLMPNAVPTASATRQISLQGLNAWSSNGPWGALVTNLAIAPSNPDILYAWTEAELFKTTDGGINWKHAGRIDHPALQVAIDTFNPETLYIRPNVFPTKAFKSTDGGDSWNPIALDVALLAMDPANPTTLYALNGEFRLSKSTDGGATWSRSGNGLPKRIGRATPSAVLAVSPGNSQTLYAASPAVSAENQGLYQSTDGGSNWSRVGVGPFRNVSMLELIVAQASPNLLYARTIEGWFRSTDSGANWSTFGFTNVSVQSLAIDPENAAIVYVGTNDGRVFKSYDGGTSWSEAVGLYGPSAIGPLVIDPRNTTNIYARTVNGVFKSTDGGARWQEANFGMGVGISSLVATAEGVLLAKDRFRSTNRGASWDAARLPGPAYAFATDPNSLTLYAIANTNDFVYKSTDAGASWSATRIESPLDYVSSLAIAPGVPSTLYAASNNNLIRSTDGGISWAAVSKFSKGALVNVSLLKIDYSNASTIYVLSHSIDGDWGEVNGSSVLKSTDGGVNWHTSTPSLPQGTWIPNLTLDPYNPSILYASINDRSVFKSTDSFATWKPTGLTPVPDRSYNTKLVIDPGNSDILYVGFLNSVYSSTDAGDTWSEINSGLPSDLQIWALVIDPSGTSLHVGTQRGVFDYQIATLCAGPLSPGEQSFRALGGPGVVEVTATSECGWTVESRADWIRVTSKSSGAGSGTVSYTVAPNDSTAPRRGSIAIAGRVLRVTQTGVPVRVKSATVSGKNLIVTGENFDPGAVILINGEEQRTKNDGPNPTTTLVAKKAGKHIKAGDRLRARNPNGSISEEFIYRPIEQLP